MIKLHKVVLGRNSYCNTISQSVFVSFAMPTACPILKLKLLCLVSNVQLVKGLLLQNEQHIRTALPCSSLTVTNDMLRY